jgi:hypothetical protein
MSDGISHAWEEKEPDEFKINKHVSVIIDKEIVTIVNTYLETHEVTLKKATLKKIIKLLKKEYFLALLVLSLSAHAKTDLVQIDVGNTVTYQGQLNMKANPGVGSLSHGTAMAKALSLQLALLGSKPVHAKQMMFLPDDDVSYFKAYSDALKEMPLVVSISLAGFAPSRQEKEAVEKFIQADILVVAASGNFGNLVPLYPARYPHPCIVSVGTLKNGAVARYANTAQVYLEEDPEDLPGTSSSTARMGAIAVVIRKQHPFLRCFEIAQFLNLVYGGRSR